MASTKVTTVQVLDSRIDPQPNPTYAVTIGPDQNQFYKIESSGLSQSSITFNNLTTLGKDRAYLDTFELEITAEVTFTRDTTIVSTGGKLGFYDVPPKGLFMPQSFPFNSVCDQVQVNINGGAFFNNPSQIIRAKERYWSQRDLQESYGNVCPCNKPMLQNEFGEQLAYKTDLLVGMSKVQRSRLFGNSEGNAHGTVDAFTSTNFDVLPDYQVNSKVTADSPTSTTLTFTWREPVMCSPFSSRFDATYGRPLYNITSIDLSFKMLTDLRNMFICCAPHNISGWTVRITACNLCYQVLTVTAPVPHDITVVPYRRYVPYITNFTAQQTNTGGILNDVEITSGVYTLNEVPTAIWIFAAPQLAFYQQYIAYGGGPTRFYNPDATMMTNKLFGFLKHISISCGNTTQILDNAGVIDLYRIAKSNGCQDNFSDWSCSRPFYKDLNPVSYGASEEIVWERSHSQTDAMSSTSCPGAGSVLRLIPGVDIVLPEQRLVPGANANNLVFQVRAKYDFNFASNARAVPIALWILFEYVGVASITPGNCMVSMNPLGNGSIMNSAPVVTASDIENPSAIEGSGWLDKIKNVVSRVNPVLKKTKLASNLLKYVPTFGPALSKVASELGYGDSAMEDGEDVAPAPSAKKRNRSTSGGAVMGLGDFC